MALLAIVKRIAPWVLAGMLFGLGWHLGSDSMDAKWKQEVHNEYIKRVEATASTQRAINEISAKYQEDLASLEGSTDRIIADLNRDNKRMRVKINTSGLTESDVSRCFPNDRVELHPETSKSLIRITQEADLKEKALQDTIRRLQGVK